MSRRGQTLLASFVIDGGIVPLLETLILSGEKLVEFLNHCHELPAILFDRNERTELLEAISFVLVHSDGEVLQHW